MAFKRPGVYVEESLLQSNPDFFPASSIAAFVGAAPRGPASPTRVESWVQFQRLYGGFTTGSNDLAHAVFQYFNNGGRTAYIARATGTGIATASRVLNNRNELASAVTVSAANGGVWGNQVYIEVTDGTADRFNIVVRYGGTTDSYIVERWTDLSLLPNDGRYAPALINSTAVGSSYIRLTDTFDHATTTFDPDIDNPAVSTVAGGDALTAGADGAAPTTTVPGGGYLTALQGLDSVDDFLTINIPGVVDAGLINAAVSYCENRGTAFLVIDCGPGLAPTGETGSVIAQANGYTGNSSYAAIYYPRLVVSDPSNNVPGSTRVIPPGGAVLGQYATTDALRGVHKAPAGMDTNLAGVVALEYRATDSDLDALNTAGVNAIRPIPGAGYCIFGARTLKPTQVDRYVNVRRNLITLRMALTAVTRYAAFEPNDETLWDGLEAVCARVLLELWQDGGLRGATADEAYFVRCDADTNTVSTVANGEVHIEVGVALETPAEFIVLRIGQYEAGSSVSEEV